MSSWDLKFFQKIQPPINSVITSSEIAFSNIFSELLASVHAWDVCVSQGHRHSLKGKELPFEA